MRILKINKESGAYQDTQGNRFDLYEIKEGAEISTHDTILTDYDNIVDYMEKKSVTKLEGVMTWQF